MKAIIEMESANKISLKIYYSELRKELDDILSWWMHNTHDAVNGGFVGQVNEANNPHPAAPKGAVLNSRILWAFSAGYEITENPDHLHLARIAYQYLRSNFIDNEHGGIHWTLDARGRPLDTKKQIYALAFGIYACSAYYRISHTEAARDKAIALYRQIERYAFDPVNGGYLEAFSRDWQFIDDLRLSPKDANEKKTMNTHLHLLEAYTSLVRIWPDALLKQQLLGLVHNFNEHIIDHRNGHLSLFFGEKWDKKSPVRSFGHDIEAAWLLSEAAASIGDAALLVETKMNAQKIAIASVEGLDADGGLWYEYDPVSGDFIKEKHWWVQAEAMVGFFDQWQQTGDEEWLKRSWDCWQYTKKYIKDPVYGEWLWGRDGQGKTMPGQDKAGIWKCPYHSSRACIELITRIKEVSFKASAQ